MTEQIIEWAFLLLIPYEMQAVHPTEEEIKAAREGIERELAKAEEAYVRRQRR